MPGGVLSHQAASYARCAVNAKRSFLAYQAAVLCIIKHQPSLKDTEDLALASEDIHIKARIIGTAAEFDKICSKMQKSFEIIIKKGLEIDKSIPANIIALFGQYSSGETAGNEVLRMLRNESAAYFQLYEISLKKMKKLAGKTCTKHEISEHMLRLRLTEERPAFWCRAELAGELWRWAVGQVGRRMGRLFAVGE